MKEKYHLISDSFYRSGIVPVIRLEELEKAEPLAKALVKGGVPLAEVTFRVAGAELVIEAMRENSEDILVGAGTILSTKQADQAIAAGAQFIVSPGFNASVVEYCLKKEVPIFPGCVTPTEIECALEYGLNVLKFFPAQQYGGIETIRALSAPYPHVRFMPTGGISLDNLHSYLANKAIIACGGSFMVKPDMLERSMWREVTAQCGKAIAIVKTARG